MLKRLFSVLLVVLALSVLAAAQEVEVDRYNISARLDPASGAIDARATLAVTNLGQTPKSRIYLRLTKLAKVSSVTVGGSPAQFEASDDRRVTTLSQIIISPQTPVEAGAKTSIDVSYRIEVPESTPVAAVYPGEVVMLPDSVWFPMPSTMFTIYGATTAPFTLAINTPAGYGAASSGSLKADPSGQTYTFEQSLNSLPLIIAGRMEQVPDAQGANGVKIEFHLHSGLVPSGDRVRRIYDEAARMIDFYTRTLGPLPAGTSFRIISSARTGNVIVPGAIVLEEDVFRQEALDAITVERLADAIARMWIDGRVRLRGQEARQAQGTRPALKARSTALLRDSLPRMLAVLFIEDRFGKDAAMDAYTRQRWSYTPVAKSARDAELGIQTPLVATYSAAVFGKGPLVFRLIAETVGREKFIAALGEVFRAGQTKIVTTDDLRQALVKASGPEVERLFQQWVDSIIEPDIVIGIPQPSDKPGSQRLNLRNLGNGDILTEVVAATASGKQITVPVTVPSEDLTSIEIATSEKIESVEVDPRKLIIQSDYDNDRKPARTSSQTLFNESIVAFNKGEHAAAEAKLKEAISVDPRNELLHAWLARSLFAQNKLDEAHAAASTAIKTDLSSAAALAWAHITLGQISLARNQAAQAVPHLRQAVIIADEAPAQFQAREVLIRAERAANMTPQVDESIRAFVAQLDTMLKQPSSDKLFTIISRNNLKRFVQGLTVSPPTSWTTEILRVDMIDANRAALDVGLAVKTKQADQSGTAVFVLYRSATGWVLEDVQLFNVK
ncbi:MAG TPA: tetratricopeptide repeat protein [Blastocatellia bacterium]|nr:tetratricopeptide repeat protein [Blastocatellia bacterium]